MENRPTVEIIKDNGHTVSVLICEVKLNLSKRCCHINLFRPSDIETVIDDIILTVGDDCCFHEIVRKLNLLNTLRIIELVCPEEFKARWSDYCEARCKEIAFYQAIYNWFGCKTHIPNSMYTPAIFRFMSQLWIDERQKKQLPIQSNTVSTKSSLKRIKPINNHIKPNEYNCEKYHVRFICNTSNIAQYYVNNTTVDICLVGRTNNVNAKTVCEMIIKLESSLVNNDVSGIKEVVSCLGGIATFRLVNSLFVEVGNKFFEQQLSMCIQSRNKPHPRKLLHTFFGGQLADNDDRLLRHLESMLPQIYDALIDDNSKEFQKEDSNWIFFFRSKNSICRNAILFDEIPTHLRPEYRNYLRHEITQIIESNKSGLSVSIQSIYVFTRIALKTLHEVTDSLSSLSNLNRMIIAGFQARLAQHTQYSLAIKKMALLYLKKMYFFTVGANNLPCNLDPFYKIKLPKVVLNPTMPVSAEFAKSIISDSDFFPPVFRLAIIIAIETGARGESICELTTDDISINENDECTIKLFNSKVASRSDLDIAHPYTLHKLDKHTSKELLAFIEDTSDLRASYGKNYIFIYTSNTFRETSLQKITRITTNAITRELFLYAKHINYCDEYGNPLPYSLRSIRAAVGRAEFQAGKTPQQVADKLGNTPTTASAHYHHMTATEKAKKYNTLYNNQLLNILDAENKSIKELSPSRKTMYGTCDATVCNADAKDCANCSARIICKTKKVDTNE